MGLYEEHDEDDVRVKHVHNINVHHIRVNWFELALAVVITAWLLKELVFNA